MYGAFGERAAGDLHHVGVGCVEERTLRAEREHGQGVRLPVGREVRALQRVDGDVDRRAALADAFTDEEHGRLVSLTLADDDRAVDSHVIEGLAHGVHRGLVGRVLVPLAHPAAGSQCRALGHLEHLDDTGGSHRSSPDDGCVRLRVQPLAVPHQSCDEVPVGFLRRGMRAEVSLASE
jgi:hypothetical protein